MPPTVLPTIIPIEVFFGDKVLFGGETLFGGEVLFGGEMLFEGELGGVLEPVESKYKLAMLLCMRQRMWDKSHTGGILLRLG